ncbi:MAG TPA: sigma 54-interacting transcriptional regulator [Terriglobales bacterium]|nr:sigma 54-interacting transcriptional regulator [Terriglobales bacterium]
MQTINGVAAVVRSQLMQRVMAVAERVAQHDAVVLIVGETGTGKELVARAIHEHSPRRDKPFVDVNCAALPEHLVESELFGYEKGAFSGADSTKQGLFELADQGTILLDEIGELDLKVQAKLLRVLDGATFYRLGGSRKVEPRMRVLAATNRELQKEVEAGRFRSDLYHRLTQLQIQVPPLRDRTDDIPALAEYFLQKHCPSARFNDDALEAMCQYSWPGNVRELKNVIFKVTLNARADKQSFGARDLPASICRTSAIALDATEFEGNLEEMERRMILQALERAGGNQGKAAQQLGISTRTLRRKMERYQNEQGLEVDGASGNKRAKQQRYFRVTIELPITIRDTDEAGEPLLAKTVNVSSGGVAIKSPVDLNHGSTFELNFTLPGSSAPMEMRAKLAWTSPGNLAGLSFTDLHPALERELHDWLMAQAAAENLEKDGK